MHRADYVVKRLAFAVMTVFVAITINFVLFRALPGNAVADLARAPHASPQLRAALTHEFGLDQPLWKQYVLYLDQLVFHANMGVSFADSQPVTSELTDKLKNTIPMVLIGTLLAIVIGIVTGLPVRMAAERHRGQGQHERGDRLLRAADAVHRDDADPAVREDPADGRHAERGQQLLLAGGTPGRA